MASLGQLFATDPNDVTANLPTFAQTVQPQPRGSTTRNPLAAGVSSGVDQMQGMGGAFAAAIGDLLGSKSIKDWGVGVYQRNQAEAAANGRNDLDKPVWDQSLGDLPSWALYRTAQAAPIMAAQIGAGGVLGRGLARAGMALPAEAAELGARAPKVLGGGGIGFGTVGPVPKEALAEGAKYATDVAGATLAGYPLAVGSMYGSAIDRGNPDQGDAAKAAILGPAFAAIGGMAPAQLKGLALRGQTGSLATRMLTGAFADAAIQMPQQAVQTAMELAFRPDVSPMDKFKNIVDSAVTGGVIGGFSGGLLGARRAADPRTITTDELKATTDKALGIERPPLDLQPPEQQQPQINPFAGHSPEQLQSQLAMVEQKMVTGQGTQQDAVARQQLRNELASRTAQVQPERTFARVSDQDLQAALGQFEQKQQSGQVTQDDVQVARRVQEELQARTQEGQRLQEAAKVGPEQPKPREFETPVIPGFENLPQQRTPADEFSYRETIRQKAEEQFNAAQVAKATAQEQVHQQVATMGGLKAIPKSFEKAGINTVEDGMAYAKEWLDQGNAPKWAEKIGKYVGFLDENGKDQTAQDVQKRLETNQTKLQDLYTKLSDTKSQRFADQIKDVQAQNAKLTEQAKMMSAIEDTARARAQEKNPPTAVDPGPARLRAPDGTYQDVKVLDKKPVEVQGKLYQPIITARGDEANVPISLLHPSVPDKAVAEVPSPALTQQAEARKPGTKPVEREKVVEPLKSVLWKDTQAAQREGMTPLRAEVAPTGDTEYARAQTPSAAKEPLSVDRAADHARDRSRYEPVLTEIVRNTDLPKDMRQAAAAARDNLRNQSRDYQSSVDKVLADYSAHTGDMQYNRTLIDQTEVAKTLPAREHVFATPTSDTYMVPDSINNPHFVTYNRRTGELVSDLHKGDDPTARGSFGPEHAAIVQAERTTMQREKELQRENPEGPFKNARENLAASASVAPELADYARELKSLMGMGDVRVFLYHPEDINGKRGDYNLYGDYYRPVGGAVQEDFGGSVQRFGPNSRDFHIMLQPEANTRLSIERLSHEIGHMAQVTLWHDATPGERTGVLAAFTKFREQTKGKTLEEVVKTLRAPETRKQFLKDNSASDLNAYVDHLDTGNKEYWTGFSEWFADQVSKWATTSAKPVGLVDKFFAAVGRKMRTLAAIIKGDPGLANELPSKEVAAFLDRVGPAAAQTWLETVKSAPAPLDSVFASRRAALADEKVPEPSLMRDRVERVFKSADGVLGKLQNFNWAEASDRLNQMHLYATTVEHITKAFGSLFSPKALDNYRDTHVLHRAITNRVSHLMTEGYHQYEALRGLNKTAGEHINKLMSATFSDIDPRKTWAEHAHLQDMPNAKMLEGRVKEVNGLYNDLKRIVVGPEGSRIRASDVYDNLVRGNESQLYMQHAISLFNLLKANSLVRQDFKDSIADPMQKFMGNASVFENLEAARSYWRGVRDDLVNQVTNYVQDEGGRLGSAKSAANDETRTAHGRLMNLIGTIRGSDAKMQQAPYFHVGRFGNYYAAFKMRADEKGNVAPETLQKIAGAIEKAGFNLSVPAETVLDRTFFRFETQDEAVRFEDLMKKFEKQGLLTRDGSGRNNTEPKLGKRGELPITHEPSYVEDLKASLRESFNKSTLVDDLTPDQVSERKAIVKQFHDEIDTFFQNRMPDSSLMKVNLQRYGVAGFTPDMMRSYAFRASLGAEALSGMYTSPKLSDALAQIKSDVNNAKVLGTTSPKQRYTMQNVMFELMKRESNRAIMSKNTFLDMLRAVNHNYFLGLSPSYVMMQMVQLPAYLWPKLASKHGFVQSAKTMQAVTPQAMRIIRAVISEGGKNSWKQMFDASINTKVLEKAGLAPADREFVLRLANNGLFDMGSQSRELGRITENNRNSLSEMAMRVSSSTGFYSEMFSRVLAALAAKKLYEKNPVPGMSVDEYARDTVSSALFEFSNWNTPRSLSKHGVAGQFTPVAAAFTNYTQQVIETLGREIHTGFMNSDASPQQKSEARKFLAAHFVAITAFAGTLGLPAASMFAAAVNGMSDIFGDKDKPFDARSSYRDWLASVFGKGVGEVIARGVPHALGMDISTRAGEADILPFSRLLADRQQWSDAFSNYAGDMLGSPISMVKNVVVGASQMHNGDVFEGAKMMMPQAIKGAMEAYRMTDKGYVDKQGNVLPMKPDALDILYQLMGITPAGKSEYDTARNDHTLTEKQLQRQAAVYRKNLSMAIEGGDAEGAQAMMDEVQHFDRLNPLHAVLPSLGQTLARRAQARNLAGSLNLPIGTSPRVQGQYDYANIR